MTQNTHYPMARKVRAVGVWLVTVALSTFPLAFNHEVKAQTLAKTTAQTPANTTTSPAREAKGGQKEGIKVHGHWTIDVRNPDGTLATHNEFENSLAFGGALAIASFLTRSATAGIWQILLVGDGSPGALAQPLIMAEPRDTSPVSINLSKNLTVSFLSGDAKVLLQASITASGAGRIAFVETNLSSCATSFPLDTCNLRDYKAFSAVTLAAPPCAPNIPCAVTLVAGQIVQVSVVFSFS